MRDIKFNAAYGDQTKTVSLSSHFGGGGGYYIYINNFFCGQILFVQGEWSVLLNPKADEELTTEDRMILVDLITV